MSSMPGGGSSRRIAVLAMVMAAIVLTSCSTSSACRGIGLDGPSAPSADEAFDAFIAGYEDDTGNPIDRARFERTPATGSSGAPDDRVEFELIDPGSVDLPARELLVGRGPDGSWRVQGGCS